MTRTAKTNTTNKNIKTSKFYTQTQEEVYQQNRKQGSCSNKSAHERRPTDTITCWGVVEKEIYQFPTLSGSILQGLNHLERKLTLQAEFLKFGGSGDVDLYGHVFSDDLQYAFFSHHSNMNLGGISNNVIHLRLGGVFMNNLTKALLQFIFPEGDIILRRVLNI